MSIFAECLFFGYCFKQYQDDEQMFADQLEQPSQGQGIAIIHIAQPEPEPELEPKLEHAATAGAAELQAYQQLQQKEQAEESEMDMELETDTLRQTQSSGVTMRGSHSPARLEEINICADVHQIKILPELLPVSRVSPVFNERFSGVAVKDEIEIFTDVELGSGYLSNIMCLRICSCCYSNPSSRSRQPQCEDLQLKELSPALMLTINTQPHSNSSADKLRSNPSLVEGNCDEEIDQYNVDDYESRTPTMWRAWWLQGISE